MHNAACLAEALATTLNSPDEKKKEIHTSRVKKKNASHFFTMKPSSSQRDFIAVSQKRFAMKLTELLFVH